MEGSLQHQKKAGGRWKRKEQTMHIDIMELVAVGLALQSFEKEDTEKHVKLARDNTWAVS